MAYWMSRDELSMQNRLRRSHYEVLRDELDQYVLDYALTGSYKAFKAAGVPYPFVEKRELKPRARIPQEEYGLQKAFLILFVEDSVPSIHKKYIRFFDVNKTTKANLFKNKAVPLSSQFDRNLKYFESHKFFDLMEWLLPVDYALLIQRDPGSKTRDRFSLSHFHVRVDWPIAEAAEDLARRLRYISKDLYEKGESYAEDLQKKFFEYYSMPVMAGGRRTAAIVAAQFLRKLPCISTIYAGSSETRATIRISERGISKCILMKLSAKEMERIAQENLLSLTVFKKNYLIAREGNSGVAIFQATYLHTPQANPPEDGKMRELKPDLHWLRVENQHLLPRPGVFKFAPLPYPIIYN